MPGCLRWSLAGSAFHIRFSPTTDSPYSSPSFTSSSPLPHRVSFLFLIEMRMHFWGASRAGQTIPICWRCNSWCMPGIAASVPRSPSQMCVTSAGAVELSAYARRHAVRPKNFDICTCQKQSKAVRESWTWAVACPFPSSDIYIFFIEPTTLPSWWWNGWFLGCRRHRLWSPTRLRDFEAWIISSNCHASRAPNENRKICCSWMWLWIWQHISRFGDFYFPDFHGAAAASPQEVCTYKRGACV